MHHFKIENMKEFLLNYREHSSKGIGNGISNRILGATYARELYFKRIKLKIQREKLNLIDLLA